MKNAASIPVAIDSGNVSEEAVRWAYRIALGREPESDAAVRAHCEQTHSLAQLRDAFFASNEFRASPAGRYAGLLFPPPSGFEPPPEINSPDRPDLRERIFAHIARSWSHYGETEPYWSVLTFDEYRKERLGDKLDAFADSGTDTVNRFLATLKRNGLAIPPGAHCIELGCGVGRPTRWLAPHFAKVTALDVSPGHIALAKDYVGKHAQNVEFRQLRGLEELDTLPPAQVFFTFLVLQHNPPPVIEALLEKIFARLTPGGIAYVHLPTFIPDYRFDVEAYLADREDHLDMEMHALPQKDVFRLAARSKMQPLEVISQTNPQMMVADYFLMQKLPAS